MPKKTVDQTIKSPDTTLKNLSQWAPPPTVEVENYPNYWSLKGWKCIVSER